MKDQLLTNIVNHVVAHLNRVLPEMVSDQISRSFAKIANCDRCGASAPQVTRVRGTVSMASYVPVTLGGGFTAVLCKDCSNAWSQKWHRALAGLDEDTPWSELQCAHAERFIYESHVVGGGGEASQWLHLDQDVHKAELKLHDFAEAWVKEIVGA